ncbi:MAG TPA: DUF6064 family protein [Deltaproteobacteria bacterium]|nr:DUF6064 family protein [Deltaproteobacteria bacterium]
MNIPFGIVQFFDVFARYNENVWPMQVILIVLALAAVASLYIRQPFGGRMIAAVLSLLWAWMGIVYHFVFFTAINPAAWLFGAVFLAGAAWFAWTGVLNNRLRFSPRSGARCWAGWIIILFALVVYPLLGLAFGHNYPATPTFGLPCPTTIFTIGILMFAVQPVPGSVFIVPVLWAAVGSMAAFKLGVFQDMGLLAAGLAGMIAAMTASSRTGRTSPEESLQSAPR